MSVKSVGKSSKRLRVTSNPSVSKCNNFQINSILNSSNYSFLPRDSKSITRPSSRILFKANTGSRNSCCLVFKRSSTNLPKSVLTENQLTYNISTEVDLERPQSELHKTADSLSQFLNVSDSPKAESSEKIKKSPIRLSVASYEQVISLDFDSAFQRFKVLKLDLIPEKLWKRSFFKKISQCWSSRKLEDENLEMAERIIKFGFTKYNKNDFFHLSLVQGVQDSFEGRLKDCEILDVLENKCSYPLIGLMNLLFLQDYFNSQVKFLIEKSESAKKALVFMLWVSDIALTILRKEKLNKLINRCKKCSEVFCFFYAGLVIRAIEKGVMNCRKYKSLYKKVNKLARGNIFEVLKIAEELYE